LTVKFRNRPVGWVQPAWRSWETLPALVLSTVPGQALKRFASEAEHPPAFQRPARRHGKQLVDAPIMR